MTEKYVKFNDVCEMINNARRTCENDCEKEDIVEVRDMIGFDPYAAGLSRLARTAVEVDPDADKTTNTVEPCPFYRTDHDLRYDSNGVPEVKVISYCQRERDNGQTLDVCYCAGRKIACTYSAQTRLEGIMAEMSPDEKERVYWIRTHMTAISRYLKNEKPEHAEKYKKLALEAAEAILRIVNGGIAEEVKRS